MFAATFVTRIPSNGRATRRSRWQHTEATQNSLAMKKATSVEFPLPGCTPLESRMLRQLVVWADEYAKRKETGRYAERPATDQFTKHFRMPHKDVLVYLNRLERRGLLVKDRQLSAGISGNGYAGALHSSVLPTAQCRELISGDC